MELEDWPAVLEGLAGHSLTNSVVRLVTVRALYETGRLPGDLFAWIRQPGPELLTTSDLTSYAGAAQLGDTLVQLGYLHAAERLAFDSLEMEGENPVALRTLARLHVVRGLTNAARIFLNRLEAYPDHRDWVTQFRAGLSPTATADPDPLLPRIRANQFTRDRVAAGLTTERLLRQALESNPENRMAFEFLMAHHLLERRLLQAVRTLATSPHTRAGPLPRHYAEAVLLHRSQYPGIALGALAPRVPRAVEERFRSFEDWMRRAGDDWKSMRPDAERDFGTTYWCYFFFADLGPATAAAPRETRTRHE